MILPEISTTASPAIGTIKAAIPLVVNYFTDSGPAADAGGEGIPLTVVISRLLDSTGAEKCFVAELSRCSALDLGVQH